MTKRPRVLIDVDGPLADFNSAWLAIINRETGLHLCEDDVPDWDVVSVMNHYDIPPLEKMRIVRLCKDETSTEGFCAGLGVARHAQQGIRALREISDVFVVTAPWNSRHWTYERDNWLLEHFDVPRKHIIHTDAKFVVRTSSGATAVRAG